MFLETAKSTKLLIGMNLKLILQVKLNFFSSIPYIWLTLTVSFYLFHVDAISWYMNIRNCEYIIELLNYKSNQSPHFSVHVELSLKPIETLNTSCLSHSKMIFKVFILKFTRIHIWAPYLILQGVPKNAHLGNGRGYPYKNRDQP